MKFLDKGKRVRQETIYFNVRLNIDVNNLNYANEIVPVTKLTKDRVNETPARLVKSLEKV